MTPALECAPMSHASNTEKRREVAIPPRSLPTMRMVKFLKSDALKRTSTRVARIEHRTRT